MDGEKRNIRLSVFVNFVNESIFMKNISLPHEWIAELKIFVQVVQAVEEVSHVTSQH